MGIIFLRGFADAIALFLAPCRETIRDISVMKGKYAGGKKASVDRASFANRERPHRNAAGHLHNR